MWRAEEILKEKGEEGLVLQTVGNGSRCHLSSFDQGLSVSDLKNKLEYRIRETEFHH